MKYWWTWNGVLVSGMLPCLGIFVRILTSQQHIARPYAKEYFNFPDRDSLYFRNNVHGLVANLDRAFKDCPKQFKKAKHINNNSSFTVIFESQRQPAKTDVFIQFQTEQLSSPVFNENYLSKLERAYQVWDFSPSSVRHLSNHLTNVRYIPMMLTHNWNTFPRAKRQKRDVTPSDLVITTYTAGCYVQWRFLNSQTLQAVSTSKPPCGLSNAPCTAPATYLWSLKGGIDVLVFGLLACSHDDMRERLCDKLEQNGIKVTCLHQVFGSTLDVFIRRSKIILNIPYYQNASLSTHRIDPLLLSGNVVMSIVSSDIWLNKLYEPLVEMTTEKNMVADIHHVLESYAKYRDRMKSTWAHEYIQSTLFDITPLCSALEELFD